MTFLQDKKRSRLYSLLLAIGFAATVMVTTILVYFSLLVALSIEGNIGGFRPYQFVEAHEQMKKFESGNYDFTEEDLTKLAQRSRSSFYWTGAWHPKTFLVVTLFSVLLVGGLTVRKLRSLSLGGKYVAADLGARRIYPSARDPNERRALNILQELSLAAGLQPLPLYILENVKCINAMAAGLQVEDSVIILTEGTSRMLTREECAGVIAHELGHVINGDSRFNLRLIAALHGLLGLTILGRKLSGVREQRDGDLEQVSTRDRPRIVILIGLMIETTGKLGLWIARLLKAGICRQRELLADATAVEFTRNPLGLAGALKKIAVLEEGSEVEHPLAEEFSHFFFSSIYSDYQSWFDSHPPLETRIYSLDPHYEFESELIPGWKLEESYGLRLSAEEEGRYLYTFRNGATVEFLVKVGAALPTFREPLDERLQEYRDFLSKVPPSAVEVAYDPYGAKALWYSCILGRQDAVRDAQLEVIRTLEDWFCGRRLRRLISVVSTLSPEMKVLLAEMSFKPLLDLDAQDRESFKLGLHHVIALNEGNYPDLLIPSIQTCLTRL